MTNDELMQHITPHFLEHGPSLEAETIYFDPAQTEWAECMLILKDHDGRHLALYEWTEDDGEVVFQLKWRARDQLTREQLREIFRLPEDETPFQPVRVMGVRDE